MATKTITTIVSCKHCGAPVSVEMQNVQENASLVGGITSKTCYKCHKYSVYNYTIKNGQFTELR